MSPGILRMVRLTVLLVLAAMIALGCGGAGSGGASGGSIGEEFDLDGAEFTVGSKEFTEQEILGNITLKALEAAGASVNDQIGLAGSDAVRTALTNGEIDMYWEYVGTAWITYMGETGDIPEPQFETVAERDLEENSVKWLEPANFSNSYGIATKQQTAEEFNIQTISDIGRLIEKNPEEATLCVGSEFAARDDGLPGLLDEYGFEFPEGQISEVGDSVVYDQVGQEDGRCNFGSIFTTDGRIPNLDLVILEDDQGFFPSYAGALTMRQEVFQENEQLAEIFAPISQQLTQDKMQELNAQVDVEGRFAEEVAEEFLRENGFIG